MTFLWRCPILRSRDFHCAYKLYFYIVSSYSHNFCDTGTRETRSDTLPDILAVVGVELRVGSKSDWAVTDDNTLASLFFWLGSVGSEAWGWVLSSVFPDDTGCVCMVMSL